MNLTPTPPPPSETPIDEGSPDWAAKIRGDLAARGYERINDPRKHESRTEIKQRVIQAGGTMDEAFEEIKRVEIQPPPSETKLSEAIDALCKSIGNFDHIAEAWQHEEAGTWQMEDAQKSVNSARSSLESLYRDLIAENERLRKSEKSLARTALLLDDQFKQVCAELSALRSLQPRPMQTNVQWEPPYPDHETAIVSIRYPYHTAHKPTKLCAIQEPHLIEDCGEFER